MSASYLTKQPTSKRTPQSAPIPGREKDMTRNNAGGFAFKADSWTRLERFIVLSSEGGSYYVGESDLTTQNVDNVRACIAHDGLRVVQTIIDISVSARAPKNDPALYALALCASFSDEKVRAAALSALPRVARTGTHLFQFCEFINSMRGWGPALRRAVANWYLDKSPNQLAYQLTKYQSRNGWSHADVLSLSHPKADLKLDHAALFRWVEKKESSPSLPNVIHGMELAKGAGAKDVVNLIRTYNLTREMIPTEVQKDPAIWEALLDRMPLTAMIRTLGRMGASGLLAPLSDASKLVCDRLRDTDYLHKSRVHPIQVLAAILTYGQGRGQKGSLIWTVVPQVTDALNDAFYASFSNVAPTNKNFYLGIDVSGSMTGGSGVAGLAGLTPNMGAAAMAMLIARTEPNHFIGGFATNFVDLKISSRDRLDAAMKKCQRDFGGTDTAVAIKHALTHKYPVDCFVVITDGETWAGDRHTSQSLNDYRQRMGRDSKLVVINMIANRTSIANPRDAGSLDVVGFDASVPNLIAGFVGGNVKSVSETETETEIDVD